ncbi:RuBisCO-cytochrome methylase [Wallemia mellicola]|nr:RuBisCO-cytochrome methylase [Wallemia mellicola]TIC19008.1 RuBisCO-cytochrome methylase [Wallemia mellicola]TIC41786.1 RuBisCO-cytochrome methylase [Wallemia mellicola]
MTDSAKFLEWFTTNGGEFSKDIVAIGENVDGMGRGLVAVADIKAQTSLFTIPRDIVLSTRTSSFKEKVGQDVYKQLENDNIGSWTPLIMAMCWEYNQGGSSKWDAYFKILPKQFTSLMFWSKEELSLLKGTTVVDKIGLEDIENEFERVRDIVKQNENVFGDIANYTLDLFKRMGSLILSRSFTVEEWKTEEEREKEEEEEEDEDEEIDLRTSVDDVAMVPMADILNSRTDSVNAHTEYEENCLRMISLQDIKAGDQIFNTYNDPPNADLIRRYGHVDYSPLSQDPDFMGNKNDVVELPADILLELALPDAKESHKERRVEFLLDECGEDSFELTHDDLVPELLKICVLLFTESEAEFKTREKSRKLPKASGFTKEKAEFLIKAIKQRMEQYGSTLEDDISKLDNKDSLPENNFKALVVTVGERRILNKAIEELQTTDYAQKKQRTK